MLRKLSFGRDKKKDEASAGEAGNATAPPPSSGMLRKLSFGRDKKKAPRAADDLYAAVEGPGATAAAPAAPASGKGQTILRKLSFGASSKRRAEAGNAEGSATATDPNEVQALRAELAKTKSELESTKACLLYTSPSPRDS